ncbi:MAG: DUF58 domain-containing protein [Planctomycetia bacterium]
MADVAAENSPPVAAPARPATASPKDALLSTEFLAKLEQLELTSRRVLSGRLKGERRSKRKGTSVEFADHRPYVAGDDLRFIDWNILIRLDGLFLKLFEEEEDLPLGILVDCSRSMDFGAPTKLQFAKQVAAALAFVGLVNLDRLTLAGFSDGLRAPLAGQRGRAAFRRVADHLAQLQPTAGDDLAAVCKTFAMRASGKGVVVLISDLMDKNGYETALRFLLAKGCDVFLIHVLAPEEVKPELQGDLRLVDAEDGDVAEVTISRPLLERYRKNLDAFLSGAQEFCRRRGVGYLFTTSDAPFERLILTYLRKRGLVR